MTSPRYCRPATGSGGTAGFRVRRPYSAPVPAKANPSATPDILMSAELDRGASVQSTNGFGTGTVTVGPTGMNEVWNVTTVAVSATGGAPSWAISAYLYTNQAAAPTSLTAATYDGLQDSTDTSFTLHAGQTLTAVWANPTNLAGTPTLTLSVYGTVDIVRA